MDFWGTRAYLNQVQQGSLPNSPYNETHWPPKSGTGSNFESLYNQALATTDPATRIAIEHEMQQTEYNIGGDIIPLFRGPLPRHFTQGQGAQPTQSPPQPDNLRPRHPPDWFRLLARAPP